MGHPFLTYLIAARSAYSLDARGHRPARWLVTLVMAPAYVVALGFAGMLLYAVVGFAAWELGIG